MKSILLALTLCSSMALGQGVSLTNSGAGVSLVQGQKLSFNGAGGTKYFVSDGTTLTLVGLTLTAPAFISGAASGSAGVTLAAGAKVCFSTNCNQRIQDDGTSAALDFYFNNALQLEMTSTTLYILTAAIRLRGVISNDTASTPLTVSDAEGLKITQTSLATCVLALEGTIQADVLAGAATGKRTKMCACTNNGSGTFAWQNLATGTLGTTTTCGTE